MLAHEARRRFNLGFAGLFAGVAAVSLANAALPLISQPAPVRAAAPSPTAAPLPTAAPAPLTVLAGPPAPPPITFAEPLPGHAINSPFGLRRLPWEARGRLHEGVDIAAPLGAAIHAAADGVVTRAGYSPSYGNFVEIRHDEGLSSFYAHMGSRARLRAGQPVAEGAVVGRVGNTGESAGAHLHFEMHDKAGRPLNPARFIGQTFEEARDLPIQAAARISPHVRLASVGRWPAAVLARTGLSKTRSAPADHSLKADLASVERVNGRIRAQIRANEVADQAPSAPAKAEPAAYTVIAKDAA